MRLGTTIILIGLLSGLPGGAPAAEDEGDTLPITVRFERPLYFPTPEGSPVLLPPGNYAIQPQGTQALRLSTKDGTAVVVSAATAGHEEEISRSFALAVPDETSPPLTHLVLAIPDGRSFQATGSADGIMPRQVPVHIMVALFKSVATGSPVQETLRIEQKTLRAGTASHTFQLPLGLCPVLCERDMDCRTFNWTRNPGKPMQGSCQLMRDVPPKRDYDCCVSGAKTPVNAS